MVNAISRRIAAKLSGFPGMRVYLQNPPTIRIGEVTKSLYQFSMQSPTEELYAEPTVAKEVEQLPEVQDVTATCDREPQVNVTINRDKSAALQVNAMPSKCFLRTLTARAGIHHLCGHQ